MKSYKELLGSDSLQEAIRSVVDAHLAEDNTNDKSDDGEGLDKVQPKAVKKKFKDRKDKDIDNDGDEDDSDKFLHKKRKAISKAIDKKKKSGKEETIDTDPKLDEDCGDKHDEPMSDDERKKIVSTFFKGLKKEDYAKYGKRAEEVMQKVAEKLAAKEYK